jgi:hypothetical protein
MPSSSSASKPLPSFFSLIYANSCKSAVPTVYYAIFAIYEPFLCVAGMIGAFFDPVKVCIFNVPLGPPANRVLIIIDASNSFQTHNMNGPWPVGAVLPGGLPAATTVTVLQLAHTCALLGIINFFVLTAVRELRSPALQEKMAMSLFTPLLVSDVSHILVTLYGIGDTRWYIDEWPGIVWITIITGLTLLIPRFVPWISEPSHSLNVELFLYLIRVCWHLGIGRYVDSRDAWLNEKN